MRLSIANYIRVCTKARNRVPGLRRGLCYHHSGRSRAARAANVQTNIKLDANEIEVSVLLDANCSCRGAPAGRSSGFSNSLQESDRERYRNHAEKDQ
jgi:hypothetical protein